MTSLIAGKHLFNFFKTKTNSITRKKKKIDKCKFINLPILENMNKDYFNFKTESCIFVLKSLIRLRQSNIIVITPNNRECGIVSPTDDDSTEEGIEIQAWEL